MPHFVEILGDPGSVWGGSGNEESVPSIRGIEEGHPVRRPLVANPPVSPDRRGAAGLPFGLTASSFCALLASKNTSFSSMLGPGAEVRNGYGSDASLAPSRGYRPAHPDSLRGAPAFIRARRELRTSR